MREAEQPQFRRGPRPGTHEPPAPGSLSIHPQPLPVWSVSLRARPYHAGTSLDQLQIGQKSTPFMVKTNLIRPIDLSFDKSEEFTHVLHRVGIALWKRDREPLLDGVELGRASCRERVCQYV